MSYVRTPEHRRMRAEMIYRWKPWRQSTGPKTAEGKAKVAMNAWKGGTRQQLRDMAKALNELEGALEA